MAQSHVKVVSDKEVEEKLAKYRGAAVRGYDAVFDKATGAFLVAGKHPTLVGVEHVVSVDVISLLQMAATAIQVAAIPSMVQLSEVLKAGARGKQS